MHEEQLERQEIYGLRRKWQRLSIVDLEGRNCIRDMQCGRRGRVPSRMVTINDENGVSCLSVDAQHHAAVETPILLKC